MKDRARRRADIGDDGVVRRGGRAGACTIADEDLVAALDAVAAAGPGRSSSSMMSASGDCVAMRRPIFAASTIRRRSFG